jgi:hypothetical protein
LPDGVFSNQKYKFGFILEGLGMQNVGLFYFHLEYCTAFGILYGHLEYCTAIWYTLYMAFLVLFVAVWYFLWQFGVFLSFWYGELRKIWQLCAQQNFSPFKQAFDEKQFFELNLGTYIHTCSHVISQLKRYF